MAHRSDTGPGTPIPTLDRPGIRPYRGLVIEAYPVCSNLASRADYFLFVITSFDDGRKHHGVDERTSLATLSAVAAANIDACEPIDDAVISPSSKKMTPQPLPRLALPPASLQCFALVVTRRSPCTSHRSDQSRFRCLRKKSKQSSLQPLSHSNTLSTASRNTSAIRNTMSIVVVCWLFSIAMFVSSSQSAKDGASSGPPEGICQSDPILK